MVGHTKWLMLRVQQKKKKKTHETQLQKDLLFTVQGLCNLLLFQQFACFRSITLFTQQ